MDKPIYPFTLYKCFDTFVEGTLVYFSNSRTDEIETMLILSVTSKKNESSYRYEAEVYYDNKKQILWIVVENNETIVMSIPKLGVTGYVLNWIRP